MTSSATSPVTSWTWLTALGGASLVVAVAAITGILTPYGEIHLPRSINSAANSAGPWAMITFASVYLSRARGLFAALLGAGSFVIMDLFFYLIFELRVGYYPHRYLAFWVGVAIVIGPLVGLCASWLRSPRALRREIAVAAPSSVLVGEDVFMLVRLPGVSTIYSVASVVVGLALFACLAAWRLRRAHRIGISLMMCAAAAGLFYTVYGLLPLVLNKVVP
jgi:Family of unknown function (DUF6518)